jgi:hypothetical protein
MDNMAFIGMKKPPAKLRTRSVWSDREPDRRLCLMRPSLDAEVATRQRVLPWLSRKCASCHDGWKIV